MLQTSTVHREQILMRSVLYRLCQARQAASCIISGTMHLITHTKVCAVEMTKTQEIDIHNSSSGQN